MNDFDKIIKQKAEQFEVPYNDAHWAEMEGKLNSIKAAKIKKNIFSAAAVITVLSVAAYFIIPNKTTPTNDNIIVENNSSEKVSDLTNPTLEKIENENTTQPTNENNESPVIMEVVDQDKNNETESKESIADNNTSTKETKESKIGNPVKETISESSVDAEFIVYNNRVCLGEGVTFEGMDNDKPVSYVWNFGDGTISNKANPTHVYKESRVYTVSLTLIDRQSGKEYTTIQNDVVEILPSPSTNFTYLEESKKYDDNKLKYPYTSFKIKGGEKQDTYKWNFGNGESSKSTNTKTIYKKPGRYDVSLEVKNSHGCVNSTNKVVVIKKGIELFAPNAFSPNQDNDNETFIPKALLGWDVQFEMKIINKTGKVVYTSTDKNEPWNGKLNNTGVLMEEGIYLWQVVVYDADGIPHSYQDKVHLIK
jgi:gliding motility-associated-like protein